MEERAVAVKSTLRRVMFDGLNRSYFPRLGGLGLGGSVMNSSGLSGREVLVEGEDVGEVYEGKAPDIRSGRGFKSTASTEGLESRLLMPKRCSNSAIVGFSLLLRSGVSRGSVLFVLSLFFGVRSRFKQVSKQSLQDGRPNRSTRGASPMFLKQFSQAKHR